MDVSPFARLLLLVLLAWPLSGAEEAVTWHSEGLVRWASLPVAPTGRIGFSQVPSARTGISFTNHLDEVSSAANRVLEDGSGVALGDIDGDGRTDIFLCSLTGRNALYLNRGGWVFENITPRSGLDAATNYICRGAVFADLNGDASPDLLLSTLGHGVLCFLNDGHGHFTDATLAAGTESKFGSMTLALADYDGDGTVDLYVANYRTDDIRDRSRIEVRRVNGQLEVAPSLRDRLLLLPDGLLEFGEPDRLYRNDGRAHFSAVSWTNGVFLDEVGISLAGEPRDWGLSAAFHDLNGDGWPDLYVCNDYWTPDRMWMNDGHGRFRAAARTALRHTSENSMGVDFSDLNGDGYVDFFVIDMLSRDPARRKRQASAQTRMSWLPGEFSNRPQILQNTLFCNRGDGTFAEIANYAGLPASEWSWQPVFIDVDMDGLDDLIISAGHTRDVQDLDATSEIKRRQHPWPRELDGTARQEAFTREMRENVRLYPASAQPVLAFHNRGNWEFEDKTAAWGTDALGVHQGIAMGDLDADGDLDFVVNNLNGVCSVYRNDSDAPRIAVRLKGRPPNTEAIGATVCLLGGPTARQCREITSGGRYLSGDDRVRVFATGESTNSLRLEVRWCGGGQSVIANLRPNRMYEIEEPAEPPAAAGRESSARAATLFEDVSGRLNHLHHEELFDDFARQPSLPRKLSQGGPGVSWFDVDGDGVDDLIVGAGRGGRMAVWHNDGWGRFRALDVPPFALPATRDQTTILGWRPQSGLPCLLVGAASYEDGLTNVTAVWLYDLTFRTQAEAVPGSPTSVGPLALGEMEGQGGLALFVGGRVVPGRYPEAASSAIYRWNGIQWALDAESSQPLARVGLVSGALWSDLDGDGWPELILACEWGPVRVFKNASGRLHEVTTDLGLAPYTGWWNGVTTGDLDGDGRLDLIVSNWGLNSPYHATPEQPVRLEYGDLAGVGLVDLIEAESDPIRRIIAPRHSRDVVAAALPDLPARFPTHQAYSTASLAEVLGPRQGRVRELQATTLATMVFLNRTNRFEARPLPAEAQFAPAFGVSVADFDGDGHEDVFLSQNFFPNEPQTPRLDAGRGLLLLGDGTGRLRAVPSQESGIEVYGEQRGAAVADFDADGRLDLVVTQNGAATRLFHNLGARPGLRLRLQGPPDNRSAIGAAVQLQFGTRWGPLRELHAGSGYWSQDSSTLVLGTPEPPTAVRIRWPGGRTTLTAIPATARAVTLDEAGAVVTP